MPSRSLQIVSAQKGERAAIAEPDRLLEREAVLTALRAVTAEASAGGAGLALLEGAAGLGTSRALDVIGVESVRQGMRVLRVRGDQLDSSFAWSGALGLLSPAVGGQRFPAAAALGVSLLRGERLAAPADSEQATFALLHALSVVVRTLARDEPLLLILDDAQWIDPSTLRLVRYLLGNLDGAGVAILLATRPGEADPEAEELLRSLAGHPATRLQRLAPLSEAAVTAIARERAGADVSDAFCRRLAEVTGANPFYIGEVLRSVSEAPEPRIELLDGLAPPLVARSVLARLVPMGGAAVEVARALAILGDGAPVHRVAQLAGLSVEAVLAEADRLAAADLVVPGPDLAFRHALVRASIEAAAPPGWRAGAHLRAAAIVHADGGLPEQVAAHLLLAPAGAHPDAAAWLALAADRASVRAAHTSVVEYLERALKEPASPQARLALHAQLGPAAVAAGSPRAVEHLAAVVEASPVGRIRAEARLALGWALHTAGRSGDAAAVFAAGKQDLEEADAAGLDDEDELAMELDVAELTARMLSADPAAWAQEWRAFAVAPSGVTPAGRHLRSQLLVFRLFIGDTPADVLAADASVLAREAVGEPDRFTSLTLWNAVGILSWCDRYAEATALIEEVRTRARDSGSVLTVAMTGYANAWPAYWSGRVVEAAADARQAVAIWSAGAQGYLPAATYWLVTATLELGRVDEAEAALDEIDEVRWRDTAFGAFLLAAQARVAAARGDLEGALDTWRRCGAYALERVGAANPTLLPWRSEAAVLAARTGEQALAVELAGDDLARAERFGAPRALGEAQRALGLAAGGEEGIALLESAVTTLRGSGAQLALAHATVDLGAALRRGGRPGDAQVHLREGLARARVSQSMALADFAADELRVSGGRPRRSIDQGEGPRSLTTSELRVASLAAGGLTNRQIAQQLFVTVKTVEWHLSHSYGKLGIKGRSSLADALGLGQVSDVDP